MSKFKKYLTSAKNGHNLSKMFNELTVSLLNKIQRGELRPDSTYGVKKEMLVKVPNLNLHFNITTKQQNN